MAPLALLHIARLCALATHRHRLLTPFSFALDAYSLDVDLSELSSSDLFPRHSSAAASLQQTPPPPPSPSSSTILSRVVSSAKSYLMASPKATKVPQTFPSLKQGQTPGLEEVAALIKEGKVKNVVIMAGAGISTAAGIPDFRSPETGLYANLEKYSLPYPEAIFDIDYFMEKPQAFFALAKELYPGNFKPTLTHYFMRLLHEKKILKSVFTQNIDTLERIAGVEDDLIIEAHGSFAEAECLACKRVYTKESIKPQIERGEVVHCEEAWCQGKFEALVKPKIVFFGEGLPPLFFERLSDLSSCDLLIVLGTSLSVQPFASLIDRVPSSCPRLLLNLESVGEISSSFTRTRFSAKAGQPPPPGFDFEGVTGRKEGIRDVRYLGSSDEGVRKLCEVLGWEKELRRMLEKGHAKLDAEMEAGREEVEEKDDREDGEAESVTASEAKEEVSPEEKQEEVIEKVGEAVEQVEKKEEQTGVEGLAEAVSQVKLDDDTPPKATL